MNTPTIEDVKNKVARERGYPNWNEYYNWIARDNQLPSVVAQLIQAATEDYMTEWASIASKGGLSEWQCCPICNGNGQILADGFISSVYQTCPTCLGQRIIQKPSLPCSEVEELKRLKAMVEVSNEGMALELEFKSGEIEELKKTTDKLFKEISRLERENAKLRGA